MRYLIFNDLYIDTQTQLLIKSGETISLAPKVYDLLVYFCKNQNRVITKDELMERVWTGSIVTENAISRTLVKVRKALDDDPKEPNFIVTVPRKGYRMVSDFTLSDELPQKQLCHGQEAHIKRSTNDSSNGKITFHEDRSKSDSKASYWTSKSLSLLFIAVIGSLLLIMIISKFINNEENITLSKQIKPYTREIGEELHPNVSNDLVYLAYTKLAKGKPSYINIENLSTQEKKTLMHASGQLSRPVWSPEEDKLAFLYKHNTVCAIYLTDLATMQDMKSWHRVSECGPDSYPSFVFSSDGNSLFFNDKQTNTNGYQIFRVDFSSGQRSIVNQPITSGLGNYAFDLSPDGKRLVMLNSEFSPETRIYTLDIEDSLLEQTVTLPYLMRSVRWSHDNETLIHPSPHPAYDIWKSSLDGKKIGVYASNVSRVKQLSRINNGEDFAFVSYLLNRDVFYKALNSISHESSSSLAIGLDNSSVMDYLPTIANQGNKYAFVSKRTTSAEIYLSSFDTNKNNVHSTMQLTFFNNPVKIYHLAFSPNDEQLLIQADNQIFIANLKSYEILPLPIDNIAINGASWIDEESIMFSTVKYNGWDLMRYDIQLNTMKVLKAGYKGGVYSSFDNHFYLLADDNTVARFNQLNSEPDHLSLTCKPDFRARKLNLIPIHDGVACISGDNDAVVSRYSASEQIITPWKGLPTNLDFDVGKKGVVYTEMTRAVADIMHTVKQ